ncbi:hypothetical protein ACFO5U_14605 [Planococcus dechangensis]|uniref:Uncharacterized protein n=1 Tax=Planococcus dechangensis TaxID=1176255 RepID=A0ABV9ME77_9BACL
MTSFEELSNKSPFRYFNMHKKKLATKEHFPILIEGIVSFLQEIDLTRTIPKNMFLEELDSFIEEAEINSEVSVISRTKNVITNNIYKIYSKGLREFHSFRGELLEYLTVHLEKDTESKIYHEPIFQHKRKKLIEKSFAGQGCLIDVVKVHEKGVEIKLIECKATLDNHINALKGGYPTKDSGKNFLKKINYMIYIDDTLSRYKSNKNDNIKVTKVLISLKEHKRVLPSRYDDFKTVNLLEVIREKIDNKTFSELFQKATIRQQ